MNKYVKLSIITVLVLLVLFVICGVAFNLIFRHISYSFYKNAKKSSKVDNLIKEIHIGKNKDIVGYIKSADCAGKSKTIIYFGGSGEIAYNAVLKYGDILNGCTLACVDYPGSQESKGSMNLKTMQESALNLYDYITNLNIADKDNIYVVGYSYGTGIAAYLASKRNCAGLALVAPYRDVIDLYNAIIPVFHSPFGWFITDNIDTKDYAKSVKAKTLIITSDSDKTIKCSIPYSLSSYFKNSTIIKFKGISHEKYWDHKEVVSAVKDFLK